MPTLEELVEYYNGQEYLNLLNEFSNLSKREMGSIEMELHRLYTRLTYIQRRYLVLDAPFSEVISEIEKNKDTFIDYQVAATNFFDEEEIDATYLIEKFCEFYLLMIGNEKRLYFYLNAVKPRIYFNKPQYIEQITKLYNQTISYTANTTNDTLCS